MQLNRNSTTNLTLNTMSTVCLSVPPNINSDGLWRNIHSPQWWLNNCLPLLELQLVMFCFIMAFIHLLLKRFGVSKISSHILVCTNSFDTYCEYSGIMKNVSQMLSPSMTHRNRILMWTGVLEVFFIEFRTGLIFGCSWGKLEDEKLQLFRIESQEILGLLSYFGYMLFLFITAVKMDVRMTMKTGKKAWIIGMPSILVPLTCGLFLSSFLLEGLTFSEIRKIPLMVSLLSMVSFPVIATLLSELKIVSTELGRLGLSSALVADLFSQCALAISNQIRISRKGAAKGYFAIGGVFVQIFMVAFVFRPAVLWIVKQTPEGKPVSRGNTQAVFLLVLLSAAASACLGQPAILGPYFLGLAIPDGGPLGFSLVEKLECFVSEFFMPMFVITCALQVDLSQLFIAHVDTYTKLNIILALVTYVAQFASVFLSSLYCQLSFRDSFILSLILSCKGVFEFSICSIITDYKIVSEGILAWFTLFLLVLVTFVPITVKCLNEFSSKQAASQNRNIMHLSQNSEFRVLACIHKNENAYGFIHLLNISCPTPQNPLAVYALHLIELVGRTTPVFISHRLENKQINEDQPYSENVILSFDHFEKENPGSVYAECFTTISPNKFMQNDICKLATDKITSLILLPFHRTWTSDGLIDQEDNIVRTLNCSVIDKAPCSVAILADKGHLGSVTSMASAGVKCNYSVCVIFLGGGDDREAISFAKRIANDSRIELTVFKLGSPGEDGSSNKWERMLDSEVIKDFKMSCLGDGRVKFLEEVSDDGPQTALRLREMVNGFDLMIVGRRKGLESSPQTSGLSEWNEFQELGVLGDLIASLDINTRTSVLVIQQQK